MTDDRLEPSAAALVELNNPKYLRTCDVRGVTTIRDTTITYDVEVGGWGVWSKSGRFGRDDAHRAAGVAFVELAREQETVMHEWAAKIVTAAQEQS